MGVHHDLFVCSHRVITDLEFVIRCMELTCKVYGKPYDPVVKNTRKEPYPEIKFCVYTFLYEYRGWRSPRIAEQMPFYISKETVRSGVRRYYMLAAAHPETFKMMRQAWRLMKDIDTLPTIENIDMRKHEYG